MHTVNLYLVLAVEAVIVIGCVSIWAAVICVVFGH